MSSVIVPLTRVLVERMPIIAVHQHTHVLHVTKRAMRQVRSAAIVDQGGTVTVAFVRRAP